MQKIIEYIKAEMPEQMPGFKCIKSQEILIPYMEIGVECLVKNITNLNLIFETILKLIDIQVNDINDISDILGVTYEFIKEAIVDMVSYDYVTVSENKLRMTKKGADALKTSKRIEIKKNYINNILVNLITEEIVDSIDITLSKPNKNSVCLENDIEIDKNFLDSKFKNLNEVYQKQQEANSVFGRISVTKELYKVVAVNYSNLKYVKNKVYIYKSEDGESVLLKFKNDINDIYLEAFYKQIKKGLKPAHENFFERDWKFKKDQHIFVEDPLLMSNSDSLHKLIKKDSSDKIVEMFKTRRYALCDEEYYSYFKLFEEINPSKIFICSNRINSVLPENIMKEIVQIAEKIPVYLLYDKSQTWVCNYANRFRRDKKDKKDKFNLIPCENIDESTVCFYSSLLINFNEYTQNILNNTITHKIPIVDFNNKNTAEWLAKAKIKYNLDEYI